MLRKKNRIKTLAGTLEIEGNFLGEEKITAIVDGYKHYFEPKVILSIVYFHKSFELV